ncbi:gamma-glutamyltransferase [Rhodoferax koreense]|uniref:Gamma-glutamyltransferase n=1 Tax=Rhodoferax koreensis TaxID=1842727 RepID=A0A1P8K0F5_9BURK|nr:gamma-glutamyltransferase family protein [Rhodoferax koreense]APW39421.1 gamma-glutamyltransferase [Rhodoferax koreense]
MPHTPNGTGAATSSRGMVTSPHALASQAGLAVLAAGGNAIEAAITIAACLGVTYPHFCGLGGDAFMVIADASGGLQTISGIGQAAQNVHGYSGQIPVRGPRAMLTTAAAVDVYGQAFEISRRDWGGHRSWAGLLAPAIALARDGFEISASERFWLDFRLADASPLTGVFEAFLADGQVPPAGFVRRQPRLAATLASLAEDGPRDFYEGRLAAAIARGLAQAGSPLTAADLAATRARIEAPLRVPYRGGELVAHQPPTQGVTTLEIMGILDRFDLRAVPEGSADHFHLMVEAVKQAFIDRNRFVADPDDGEVPTARLLSAAHLDARAAAIDPRRALPWPHVFQKGDTVYIAAADAFGNAVSMLATVYFDWGSGVVVGDTGLVWHNRGAAFSLDPQHPNCLAPGKRPFHTLNPGMYLEGGKPAILYGTQGADGQPQTLAAILTRLIDYGLDPAAALARPRFLLGKTFSDARDSLKLEADLPEAVFTELAARGHALSRVPAQSPLMGHPGAIRIDPATGVMTGAHDPRSDGRAMGLA